ncbi:MAG: endonuclease/exonuclease/phosphatase family protein [Dokdonella sp.]|uniref:endonuclease/exonuclease/phosphatase family protein n=1 Tax=Dokdonella sp. TaxID=2291710 RepID=UPI003265F436
MRIATWNMHAGVGLDRRFDPDRIARVINELDADVVALQEFGSRGAFDMCAHLQAACAMHMIVAPTFLKRGSDFGNALLTRSPPRDVVVHALGVDTREPRNAIDLRVDLDGGDWRLVATHLGLRTSERRIQVGKLVSLLGDVREQPTVLLGDFNEWSARGALATIDQRFGMTASPKTFPSLFPLSALDRIWIAPATACAERSVHRSRLARLASDHLPLVAALTPG